MPSLSSHPIFQIDVETLQSSQQNDRRNVVVLKDSEVYVAIGSTVRYAELRDWYAIEGEPENKSYYQTLKFPTLNFDIQKLVWNQSGTHLALVGQLDKSPQIGVHSAQVLSTRILTDERLIHIGKTVYSEINRILKVAFHPQSKHDNTVVVLSSDSHLRVFELSLSSHAPEQDIPLFSIPKRGYTVDFDIPIPISFTFAHGTDWLTWTIFILTHSGDVYALCPIMPVKCVVPRSSLLRMKTIISLSTDQLKSEDCTLMQKETCLNQMRWISDILGQISMSEFMGVTMSPALTGIENTGDVVTFKRPNKVRPTPEIQGPVLFQPPPVPMDDVFAEAEDIVFLDAQGVRMFVTTWQGGRVDIGVLVQGVSGVWNVKGGRKEDVDEIKIAAYESLDLPVRRGVSPHILKSANDGESVFIVAEGMAWQLDFRGWLHELRKLDQDDEDDDDGQPYQSKPSQTKLIVNESPDNIVGCGILFDPLLDYHLLTLSSTATVKFTELAPPTITLISPTITSPSPTKTRRITKPATYLAYPFPDLTPLNAPAKSIFKDMRIASNLLREKDPLSPDALQLLGDLTIRIRNLITAILRVASGLRQRMELQNKELVSQLSKLRSSINTVSSLVENDRTQATTISEIKLRQQRLEVQANTLLRKLLTMNEPQTSEAEEKWFKELTRVKARLDGQRGLVPEIKARLAEGRKFVEMASKRSDNGEETEKRKIDWRVMEAIEEAYVPFLEKTNCRTRKVDRLKMRTARLNAALG